MPDPNRTSQHPLPIVVRNISDTARWAAVFRARENQRPDALFRDPFAGELAGALGEEIANTLPEGNSHAWAWVARTYLFDQFIAREIARGAGLVLNLAAGLDARPYRMELPPDLEWVEVDLPEILDYKEGILGSHPPRCRLERVRLDLSDRPARRELFGRIEQRAKRVLVLTEGLLIYFEPSEVELFSADLGAGSHFERWVTDLSSPGLLGLMQRSTGRQLGKVGAQFRFAPASGPAFFRPGGWESLEVRGLLETAARFGRPPFLLRLLARLPHSKKPAGRRPWSGVCLLERKRPAPL